MPGPIPLITCPPTPTIRRHAQSPLITCPLCLSAPTPTIRHRIDHGMRTLSLIAAADGALPHHHGMPRPMALPDCLLMGLPHHGIQVIVPMDHQACPCPFPCYHTITPVSPSDPPPHFRGSRQLVGLVSYNSLSLSDHSMISSSLEPAPSSPSLSRFCRHGHDRSRVRVRGPRGLGIRPLLKGICHEPLDGIFHERAVTCAKGPPCSEHSSVN